MKTIIFWLLKLAEVSAVAGSIYIGYLIGDYRSPHDPLIAKILFGCSCVLLIMAIIVLALIIIYIAIPNWIALNREWADKIYKRISK